MSVISGIFQSEAAGDAADTSAQASRDAAATQYKMFQEQQAAMEPWRVSGFNALNQLNALMGLPQVPMDRGTTVTRSADRNVLATDMIRNFLSGNPTQAAPAPASSDAGWIARNFASGGTAPATPMPVSPTGDPTQARTMPVPLAGGGSRTATPAPADDWRSLMDPGYEFRKQEGINALAAAGAASGNYGSGNMGVALQDFGQNLASQEFQNVYNRLAGMSGTGQVQSQAIGGMGVNTGNAMANYLNQAGANIAQGQVAGSNALFGGVRDLEKGIASYYMFKDPASDYMSQSMFDKLWS